MANPATSGVLKTKLADMKIGDYIRAKYTATSGAVGTFSELGIMYKMGDYPNMTSDTTPSPFSVSASSYYSGSYNAYLSFDDATNIDWCSAENQFPCWLKVSGTQGIETYGYSIVGSVSAKYSPTNWIMQGSNDDINWTNLDVRSSISWTASEVKSYTFASSVVYSFYRLFITSSADGMYCMFTRLKMQGLVPNDIAELPATPTATPDGSFNFIKVDKGLAIADRNIQSSISWDNLAIGGLVYGKGNKLRWKLPNPDVLPPNTVYGTAISPDSKYFVVGFDASPRIHIYENVNGSYVKLPNPDVLPTGGVYGNGLSFSSDSKYLAVSHLTSPFVTIYKITNGLFVKLPNPATLPAGTGRGCCFSDDGKYLAVTHTATPYFTIYKREANDVYTKLSNPATLPTSDGMTCSFSPDGNYLAIGGSDATILYVYSIANDVFTKLSNPSTLPSGTTYAVAFSKDSKYFAVAHGTSRFITIYSISGGSIVKLADPATLPTGIANGCSFDPNGNLIVNSTVSPYIFFYSKMGETFVKQDNPSTLPTGAGYGLCISKNGEEVYSSHATTPFVTIYKNLTTGTIRSLSGGTAYSTADGKSSTTDTSNGAWPPNNEWDTHIRKSTLNGKIVAGDNAVWNWNAPTRPWCMEAVAMSGMASNMRMARGRTSIDNISPDASTSVGTQYSFRPVLEWDEENQKVT